MTPQSIYKPGDLVEGFRIIGVLSLPEMRGTAVHAEHVELGTRFLHIRTPDEENVCSILVPTPPADDTGLPHIMEHSVLGGSRKYPLKDPFFEMLKTSLATFINAMTASDFTVYPFSSVVRKDLFNLAEVYFDAVFHPLLRETTFRREAFHLRPACRDEPGGPIAVNGIVFNEMRSAYSSPDNLLWREISKSLFDGSPLRFDSGGWPDAIPDLTYDAFRKFHQTRYHPSNAYLFAWGNVSTEDLCAFFNSKFAGFSRLGTPWSYRSQPRWKEPRRQLASYPVGPTESTREKTYLSLAWIVGSSIAPDEIMAWRVLFQILIGHDAAPLKKALVDSKLGTDLGMNFVYPVGPELLLTVGLRGSEPGRTDAFRELVLSALQRAAKEGFTEEQVRTAVRQLSYQHLERTQYFVIDLMMSLAPAWMRTDDPFSLLDLRQILGSVEKKALADPGFLKSLLERNVISNQHCVLQTLTPDPAMADSIGRERDRVLAEKARAFGPEGLKRVCREADEVEELNRTIDTPELLNLLPRLRTPDLPEKPWEIPSAVAPLDDRTRFIRNDLFTNGICYFVLDFDLSGLDADLYPFLPLFKEAFDKMGTSEWSYLETSSRRASASKLITCQTYFISDLTVPGRHTPHLKCYFTATEGSAPEAMQVLEGLLRLLDPSDAARLETVARQYLVKCRDRLLESGPSVCRTHATRTFTAAAWQDYLMNGAPAYGRAQRFTSAFGSEKDAVVKAVRQIRDHVVSSARWTVSFTGPDRIASQAERFARDLSNAFPRRTPADTGPAIPAPSSREPVFEGLSLPIQNCHSMIVIPAYHSSHPEECVLRLATEVISSDYWLTQVRLKGNAYGAYIGLDRTNAVWNLMSYADPDFRETWKAFKAILDYARTLEISRDRLEQFVIGALRPDLNPLKPDQATHRSLERLLRGETPEFRLRQYRTILAATPEGVKRTLTGHLESNAGSASFCVAASRENIDKVAAVVPKDFRILDILGTEA